MRYNIGSRVGNSGGFGTVYECTSEQGVKYALKVLDDKSQISVERFEKEIRLIKRLSHPNIIKIIASKADNDMMCYVMPLYKSSLADVIPTLYGDYARQYAIITEILNGVEYLHSEGVLHRDLKPQNILYNSDNDIVINDFGLGRQIDSESDCNNRLTHLGDRFGTPQYSAPEQMYGNGARKADVRSDIFSLGKIIEDIVTSAHSEDIPSAEFQYVIAKCTNTDPAKRFCDVVELKAAIDSIYQQLLGISERNNINDYMKKLKMGSISYSELHTLSLNLLNSDDGENIEGFFYGISPEQYAYLEKHDIDLLKELVFKIREYYVRQGWGFSYTDKIGNNCQRIYLLSTDPIIRANFLYIIIQVGISHNRFYVMRIAENLLKEISTNTVEAIELSNLINSGGSKYGLHNLSIPKSCLPSCLVSYFQ